MKLETSLTEAYQPCWAATLTLFYSPGIYSGAIWRRLPNCCYLIENPLQSENWGKIREGIIELPPESNQLVPRLRRQNLSNTVHNFWRYFVHKKRLHSHRQTQTDRQTGHTHTHNSST